MEQVNAWILQNPLWVDGPLRVWLAFWMLVLVVHWMRYGRSHGSRRASRYSGLLVATGAVVTAWLFYAKGVVGWPSL